MPCLTAFDSFYISVTQTAIARSTLYDQYDFVLEFFSYSFVVAMIFFAFISYGFNYSNLIRALTICAIGIQLDVY